ncbi:MAG TPA: hypothetical protein VG713_13400 [Pirellulales bacterium]|nr:hypothetical protein [Pirellulales bacterium]
MRWLALILLSTAALGCAPMRAPYPRMYENPIRLPSPGCDYLWDRLVDSVDDYFEIEREERPKRAADVMTAGRIDTFPLIGATLLEPWRGDSVGHYERTESTLQSIRRRAVVQVIPAEGGYLVDVAVYKELEDLPRPDYSPTGAASFRVDNSLSRLYSDPIANDMVASSGWIPLGRDEALEQKILCRLVNRMRPAMSGGFVAQPLSSH